MTRPSRSPEWTPAKRAKSAGTSGGFLFVASSLAACQGPQSALDPSGPVAREVALLWWVMFWGGTIIFALVLGLIVVALVRRGPTKPAIPHHRMIVGGGIVLPLIVLSALLPFSALTGTGSPPRDDGITINVVGHQWWWEFEYVFGDGSQGFATANEISIPIGEPVELVLTSEDVIHSFWLPRLAGKLDLIPGHTNRMTIEADEAGASRGQCAEFCGLSHAMMSFQVEARSPDEFAAWAEDQRAEAAENPDVVAGAALFQQNGCALCHTVRGQGAWGAEGPDLTHVGSRGTIAAGALDNTAENIAYWIARNNEVKPGNKMPEYSDLDRETRMSLARYLKSLK